ncbi:MAG TPA: hypothetical protein VF498_03515 [Anaerolineales bacterium]
MPNANWKKTGIIPDLTVRSNWDQVTMETDPVVKAALDHFDEHSTPAITQPAAGGTALPRQP